MRHYLGATAQSARPISSELQCFTCSCNDNGTERIYQLIEGFKSLERFVPVTAKLSRKFYERLGDDIAGELVDWFNAVDASYQTQLREINDLNWERFKAELRAHAAELRAEMAELRAELRGDISRSHASLVRWMFVFWTGAVAALWAFSR